MDVIHHPAPAEGGGRVLLVALPGVGIEPKDFAEHGVVQAVQACRPEVEVVAAAADFPLYLDRTVVDDIHRQIVLPVRAERPVRLWFLGISLGGMGALLYARAHPELVEGVILLAPFLGTPGMVAEIIRNGGFAHWEPSAIMPQDTERLMLGWLKDRLAAVRMVPALYLGYGRGDRFAAGHALLADRLPEERVFLTEGGHDWETWTTLWRQIVETDPFAAPAAEPCR